MYSSTHIMLKMLLWNFKARSLFSFANSLWEVFTNSSNVKCFVLQFIILVIMKQEKGKRFWIVEETNRLVKMSWRAESCLEDYIHFFLWTATKRLKYTPHNATQCSADYAKLRFGLFSAILPWAYKCIFLQLSDISINTNLLFLTYLYQVKNELM